LGCEGVKLKRQNLFSGLELKVVHCLGSRAHYVDPEEVKLEELMVYDGVSSGGDA
jgi:hypothetical protein